MYGRTLFHTESRPSAKKKKKKPGPGINGFVFQRHASPSIAASSGSVALDKVREHESIHSRVSIYLITIFVLKSIH